MGVGLGSFSEDEIVNVVEMSVLPSFCSSFSPIISSLLISPILFVFFSSCNIADNSISSIICSFPLSCN